MKFNQFILHLNPFLTVICIGLLLTNACNAQENKSNQLEKEITGVTWIHSYEDDEGELKAYRPQDYNFPPSRGRQGFRMESDGSFILYGIAPTDGVQTYKGKWEKKDDLIKVTFTDAKGAVSFGPFHVVSLKENLLKIKEEKRGN